MFVPLLGLTRNILCCLFCRNGLIPNSDFGQLFILSKFRNDLIPSIIVFWTTLDSVRIRPNQSECVIQWVVSKRIKILKLEVWQFARGYADKRKIIRTYNSRCHTNDRFVLYVIMYLPVSNQLKPRGPIATTLFFSDLKINKEKAFFQILNDRKIPYSFSFQRYPGPFGPTNIHCYIEVLPGWVAG